MSKAMDWYKAGARPIDRYEFGAGGLRARTIAQRGKVLRLSLRCQSRKTTGFIRLTPLQAENLGHWLIDTFGAMIARREQSEPIPTRFDLEDTKARKHARIAALRADAEAKRQEVIARWRAVDPSARTCSDGIAIQLAELAAEFGGKNGGV